jgi:hypothetical protein
MATKFKHRPQTEEEDAAALKLGPGKTLLSAIIPRARYSLLFQ